MQQQQQKHLQEQVQNLQQQEWQQWHQQWQQQWQQPVILRDPIRAPSPGFQLSMTCNLMMFMPPHMVKAIVYNLDMHLRTNQEAFLNEFLKGVIEVLAHSGTHEHAGHVKSMIAVYCPQPYLRYVERVWKYIDEFKRNWATVEPNMKLLATVTGLFETLALETS